MRIFPFDFDEEFLLVFEFLLFCFIWSIKEKIFKISDILFDLFKRYE